MRKHLQYFKYVIRHKWYTFKAARSLGITWLGIIHDWTKFLPSEWFAYVNDFYGGPYPTDEEADEQEKRAMRIAQCSWRPKSQGDVRQAADLSWLLHQHKNRHHWQHWVLQYDDGQRFPLPMPNRYRREMLADWSGAGLALGKPDITAWYKKNRHNIILHPETREWVEKELGIT